METACFMLCKALMVINEKVTTTSDTLRHDVSMELGKNAHLYARQLWQHSVQTAKSTHDSFTAIVLVQSCLSTAALEAFQQVCHKKRPMSTVLVVEKALLVEAQLTASSGVWSSLPQMVAAATVTQTNIQSVYPEVNIKLQPLLHTTLEPLQVAATRGSISIMWSNTSPVTDMTGMVSLSHFVPLLPYEFVQPKLPTTAKQQQGLKTQRCKQVTLADFLLPKKLSPRKKRTKSSNKISQFKNNVESYSPPSKIQRRLSQMSFEDDGMGADDFVGKMESLATDCGTNPFHAKDKAKHGENEEEKVKNYEYELRAGLEDVVSYGLRFAGEVSGHSSASSAGQSSSSTHSPPALHHQETVVIHDSCETKFRSDSGIDSLTSELSPADTECSVSDQLPVVRPYDLGALKITLLKGRLSDDDKYRVLRNFDQPENFNFPAVTEVQLL